MSSARKKYQELLRQGVSPGRALIESGLIESERAGKQHYTVFAPEDSEDEDEEEYSAGRESDMPDYAEPGRFRGAMRTPEDEDEVEMEMGRPRVRAARKPRVTSEVIEVKIQSKPAKPPISDAMGSASRDMMRDMEHAVGREERKRTPGGQILESIAEDIVQRQREERIPGKILDAARRSVPEVVQDTVFGNPGRIARIIRDVFGVGRGTIEEETTRTKGEDARRDLWADLRDSVDWLVSSPEARSRVEASDVEGARRAKQLIRETERKLDTLGRDWLLSDDARRTEAELQEIFADMEMEEAEAEAGEARREERRRRNREER